MLYILAIQYSTKVNLVYVTSLETKIVIIILLFLLLKIYLSIITAFINLSISPVFNETKQLLIFLKKHYSAKLLYSLKKAIDLIQK